MWEEVRLENVKDKSRLICKKEYQILEDSHRIHLSICHENGV